MLNLVNVKEFAILIIFFLFFSWVCLTLSCWIITHFLFNKAERLTSWSFHNGGHLSYSTRHKIKISVDGVLVLVVVLVSHFTIPMPCKNASILSYDYCVDQEEPKFSRWMFPNSIYLMIAERDTMIFFSVFLLLTWIKWNSPFQKFLRVGCLPERGLSYVTIVISFKYFKPQPIYRIFYCIFIISPWARR